MSSNSESKNPEDCCPQCDTPNTEGHTAECPFAEHAFKPNQAQNPLNPNSGGSGGSSSGSAFDDSNAQMGDYTPESWNPAVVLRALAQEQEVYAEETATPEKHIRKIMRENSAFAAQSIVWLSRHSVDEKMRYDASRYIIERTLGKINDVGFEDTAESAAKRLFDKVTVEISNNN